MTVKRAFQTVVCRLGKLVMVISIGMKPEVLPALDTSLVESSVYPLLIETVGPRNTVRYLPKTSPEMNSW